MSADLVLGTERRIAYSMEEARDVLAGYAFGTTTLGWKRPDGPFDLPEIDTRPLWAYRSYDCVPTDPLGPLTEHDILLTAGLNSRIEAKAALSLLAAAPAISAALAQIDERFHFWDASPEQVADPGRDTATWFMWKAWWLTEAVPGADAAVTHKTLHHKRPDVFPLLDNRTLGCFPKGQAWIGIHEDLVRQRERFEELERWFGALAQRHGGVRLTRLRIHDILLWVDVSDERDATSKRGRAIETP